MCEIHFFKEYNKTTAHSNFSGFKLSIPQNIKS